jgi:dihydroxyacetone kinase-like protein
MERATGIDSEMVRAWMHAAATSIHEQRDHLTQLDAAIGDADHGTNMDRGFAAVVEKLDALPGSPPPGQLLITAGNALVSTVGGASGPLWGTALRRAGRALGDTESVDCAGLATALDEALASVVELGAAEEGDKTMVDALAPALRALRERVEDGAPSRTRLPRRAPPARPACERPCLSGRARDAPPISASEASVTRTPERPRRF